MAKRQGPGKGGGGGKKQKTSGASGPPQASITRFFQKAAVVQPEVVPLPGPEVEPLEDPEVEPLQEPIILPQPVQHQQPHAQAQQVITNSNNSVASVPVGATLPCGMTLPSVLPKPPEILQTPRLTPSPLQILPPSSSSPVITTPKVKPEKEERDEEEEPKQPRKVAPQKMDINATRTQLLMYVKSCDASINKMWDSAGEEDKREKFRLLNRVREYNETLDVGAINGSKHNDCDRQVADKRGAEQQPSVALMLGRLKHECVEAKLNAKPRKFTSAEQAFKDGQLLEDRFTKGSLRPDIVMHKEPLEGSSDVVAIFDLKFPCPSEGNKSGHWGTRNDGKRQDVAYKEEFPDASIALIYPALKK